MPILTMPIKPGFRSIEWAHEVSVGVNQSPFNLTAQRYDWGGTLRIATITLPKMVPQLAKQWAGFFLKCRGPAGSFYLSDSAVAAADDKAKGSPLINGASQTGTQIITDGWLPARAGILKAADWISIADQLYQLTDDVDTDAAGGATINIEPGIPAAYADDTALEIYAPRGVFRLAQSVPLKWGIDRLSDEIVFNAIEIRQTA